MRISIVGFIWFLRFIVAVPVTQRYVRTASRSINRHLYETQIAFRMVIVVDHGIMNETSWMRQTDEAPAPAFLYPYLFIVPYTYSYEP